MRYALSIFVILVMAACSGSDDTPTSMPTIADTAVADLDPVATGMSIDGEIVLPTELPPEQAEVATFEALAEAALNPPPIADLPTFTPDPSGGLPVPLPGTLVASETEEPEPFGDFTFIRFQQFNYEGELVNMIEMHGDGRVLMGNATRTLSADAMQQINEAISDLNFFGVQGTFMGPPGDTSAFTYRIAVETPNISRAINAQDGFIPVEFRQFLGLIRNLGEQSFGP